MDPIEVAITEIESLEPGEYFTYIKMAEKFGVSRTTLSRRHRRVTRTREQADQNRKNLNEHQERELVRYITELYKRGLPPIRVIVKNFASSIARKEVSIS